MSWGEDFDHIIQRVIECGSPRSFGVKRELLHAYLACLSAEELIVALFKLWESSADIRGAIRNRVLRICKEMPELSIANSIVLRLLEISDHKGYMRVRKDSWLSALYSYAAPDIRQRVLEYWVDSGTKSAGTRWVRAISSDRIFFDENIICYYWIRTKDEMASKIIAKDISPEFLEKITPDLIISNCEGWIVSKALLKCNVIADESLQKLRELRPSTFAYVCYKRGIPISQEDMADIIETYNDPFDSERGLAVWVAGQLKMSAVLDKMYDKYITLVSAHPSLDLM